MMHTNNPIVKHKAGLLNLAEELGHVFRDCFALTLNGLTRFTMRQIIVVLDLLRGL